MFLKSCAILTLLVCVSNGQFNFDFGKILGDVGRSIGINRPTETTQKDIGEPPIYVSGKWMKSSNLNNNQLYLFAEHTSTMTWYDADKYCGNQGAILAEPVTNSEMNFLRNQANRLPKTNWWIGLRQFEKCECISLGRSATKVEAFTDPDSLQITANNGLGGTYCPGSYQKSCNGMEWRWGISGQKPTYTYWNTKTGEPNDVHIEHCVTLWFKSDNQRWGNWRCSASKDGDKHGLVAFKPICQKSNYHDDDDYDDY